MSSSEANSLLACFLCEFCSELLASKRMFNGKLITLLGVGREKQWGLAGTSLLKIPQLSPYHLYI